MREETCCRHMGYSFRLTARVLIYAPSHRQDSTYHGLCYTSRGALAGMRNNSMGPPHEGSIWRPIVPWANALTTELHLGPLTNKTCLFFPSLDWQHLPTGVVNIADGGWWCSCQRCQLGTTPICKIMTICKKILTNCQHHCKTQFWYRIPL